MTTTAKPIGVPIEKTNFNPFIVKVEAWWRDCENNFKPRSKIIEFKGKDKADVYEYIKYYALAFGLSDVVHKGEGYGSPDCEPDMADPYVQKTIAEHVNETTQAIQGTIDVS